MAFTLSLFVIMMDSAHPNAIIQSVIFEPTSQLPITSNGVTLSVLTSAGFAYIADHFWRITNYGDTGFDLQLSLNNSWSFNPSRITNIKIEIETHSFRNSELLVSFQSNDKYITTMIDSRSPYDHLIYPQCQILPNKSSIAYGDVKANVEANNGHTLQQKAMNNTQYYLLPHNPSNPPSSPLTFILQNNPFTDTLSFTYDDMRTIRTCNYGAMPVNSPLDIYIVPNKLGQIFYVDAISVSYTTSPSNITTARPSAAPTIEPTRMPLMEPTIQPTVEPSTEPTIEPTLDPTAHPSTMPTIEPTIEPTTYPTAHSSAMPTKEPSNDPTNDPSAGPTIQPTAGPSIDPTNVPTYHPTAPPTTFEPSTFPSAQPSVLPSELPSGSPTNNPSSSPSNHPTDHPSVVPTIQPTIEPSYLPTDNPSAASTMMATDEPSSLSPTFEPSEFPSVQPSVMPTEFTYAPSVVAPTDEPTNAPTYQPSVSLTMIETGKPSLNPTFEPSEFPSKQPAVTVFEDTTLFPTHHPSAIPTNEPSIEPTDHSSAVTTKFKTDITDKPSSMRLTLSPKVPTNQPTASPVNDGAVDDFASPDDPNDMFRGKLGAATSEAIDITSIIIGAMAIFICNLICCILYLLSNKHKIPKKDEQQKDHNSEKTTNKRNETHISMSMVEGKFHHLSPSNNIWLDGGNIAWTVVNSRNSSAFGDSLNLPAVNNIMMDEVQSGDLNADYSIVENLIPGLPDADDVDTANLELPEEKDEFEEDAKEVEDEETLDDNTVEVRDSDTNEELYGDGGLDGDRLRGNTVGGYVEDYENVSGSLPSLDI